MRVITMTKKQIERLKKLPISNEVTNTESIIYRTDTLPKNKVPAGTLLKYLYIKDKESFANKLYTIEMLSSYGPTLGLKELVIPDALVSVENQAIGFTIPEVKNATNLGIILKDPKIDKEKKMELLRKVGELLGKTQNLDKYGINFYFNDMHEFNFLVDNETEEIYAIDLDSASFSKDHPLGSYYMVTNPNMSLLQNKYKMTDDKLAYPDHNTDLLCYTMMVINTIADFKVSKLPLEEYYAYLEYLRQLGFGEGLINAFASIYTNGDNKNVSEFFDEIPISQLYRASYNVFKAINKKNKAGVL